MSVMFSNNINNLCVYISYAIFALFGGSITNGGNKKQGSQTPLHQDLAARQTTRLVQPKSYYARSLCQLTSKQFLPVTNLIHFFQCIYYLLIYLFHFPTCFEQPSAHHQENRIVPIHPLVRVTLCR